MVSAYRPVLSNKTGQKFYFDHFVKKVQDAKFTVGHLPQFCFIEVNALGVPLNALLMPSMGYFWNAFLREFEDSTSKMPNLGNLGIPSTCRPLIILLCRLDILVP